MILVVARQRISDGGNPNRLIVKHSSSPSRRQLATQIEIYLSPLAPQQAASTNSHS
jgi:hypothetical protein